MQHFIAYHNAQKMGNEYGTSGELGFLSRKPGVLKQALGNTVWVIQGVRTGGRTLFTLCGAYVAEQLHPQTDSQNTFRISGRSLRLFKPPLPLNGLDWFQTLFESQRNFSLGFNRISDESVIEALNTLLAASQTTLPDSNAASGAQSAEEGELRLQQHFIRERDRTLVAEKRRQVLSKLGRLRCEACEFDFAAFYGELGRELCEVHHVTPLSRSASTVLTRLDDLAILCANCHRLIHRTDPMITVAALREIVAKRRSTKA